MFYLLGLLARAGHGKTSVATHVARTYGAEVRSLAGPMKRAVQRVFGFDHAQLWGDQAAKEAVDPRYGFSPRWLLQRLGTEGLRDEFGPDVHHRAFLHGIRRELRERGSSPTPALFVVDDVRFPDDAAMVAEGGPDFRGTVLKIVAVDAAAGTHGDHVSESAIDAVAPGHLGAVIEGRKADGLGDMLARVDWALREAPGLAALRPVLNAARSAAEGARP